MAEPDWEDPKVEAAWFAEQRALAERYLRGQQALFGAIEPEPAWFIAPVVAFWRALGARTGEPAHWVITGDLPSDFLASDVASTPRAAAAKEHPTIHMARPSPARRHRFHEQAHSMSTVEARPRVTSFAPQFLVDDLGRSIAFYEKLGFTFGEPWDGFYAIGRLDGLELHLKEAPKYDAERRHRREHEHLDAAAGVDGIEAFCARCTASGVRILKPLTPTAWGTLDFYVEDPDGYIVSFGGRPAAD